MDLIELLKNSVHFYDLDGTLIDSTDVWNKVDNTLILEAGGIPDDDIAIVRKDFFDENKHLGNKIYDAWLQFEKEHYNLYPTLGKLAIMKSDCYVELLKEVEFKPNAGKHLNKVYELNLPQFLVTLTSMHAYSIYRYENAKIIGTADFSRIFAGNVITSDMVSNIKPDPECYLIALKMANVPPEQVVVYEDTVKGVDAAKKSGIKNIIGVFDEESKNDMDYIKKNTIAYIYDFKELGLVI